MAAAARNACQIGSSGMGPRVMTSRATLGNSLGPLGCWGPCWDLLGMEIIGTFQCNACSWVPVTYSRARRSPSLYAQRALAQKLVPAYPTQGLKGGAWLRLTRPSVETQASVASAPRTSTATSIPARPWERRGVTMAMLHGPVLALPPEIGVGTLPVSQGIGEGPGESHAGTEGARLQQGQ